MEKYLKQSLKLANKKIAFVGSVKNNAPNIKAMLVAKHDGLKTFYFASNYSVIRTEQFKQNSNACIYFNSGPIYQGLMLEGTMKILNREEVEKFNNEESKKFLWNYGMKKIYKNGGVNDPDYCVLKFTAFSGRHYYMLKTNEFKIE